ncbi:hypothetical protein FACS189450_13300 [Spirochaetia bacterium]|nr:hypothetical protein FACS189450_13300 [Spirochaetia bacterium]
MKNIKAMFLFGLIALTAVITFAGCATGDNSVGRSEPAPGSTITWTVAERPFGNRDSYDDMNIIRSVAYGGGKFVAGWNWAGKMAYSTDGVTWTAVADSPFGGSTQTITHGGGKFVAVGWGGEMAYSTDGVTWTAIADRPFGDSQIYGITYGGGKFVAVGDKTKTAYSGTA